VRVGLYLQALKFDWDSLIHSISLRFRPAASPSQRWVGDDWHWAAPGPCVSEAGAGSARPAGSNSAHGQIKLEKSFKFFKSFLNSKPI
jgi:hypothetical protein